MRAISLSASQEGWERCSACGRHLLMSCNASFPLSGSECYFVCFHFNSGPFNRPILHHSWLIFSCSSIGQWYSTVGEEQHSWLIAASRRHTSALLCCRTMMPRLGFRFVLTFPVRVQVTKLRHWWDYSCTGKRIEMLHKIIWPRMLR